jgi:sugar phosphate permease
LFAAVNALVVFSFLAVTRNRPKGSTPPVWDSTVRFGGLGVILGMYSYWAISFSNFVRYGYFAALQSLWLGTFLLFGLGLGEIAAGNVLLCLSLGYMAGLPFWGYMSDRVVRSRKRVIIPTMAAYGLVAFSMAWFRQGDSYWLLAGTVFLIGFMASPGQITYAHIKELMPPTIIAQGMTAVNLFTTLGVGAMIHVLGWTLGSDPSVLSRPEGFQPIWYVGALGLAMVCLVYTQVRDSKVLQSDSS